MLTIGCDPEVFLKNDGSIVSSIGLIGGSKKEPRQVKEGALQEDNVLAEINIDPAATPSQFIRRINRVLSQLQEITGCSIEVVSSHTFDKTYLLEQPRKAFNFGCDPDYNIYTQKENKRPNPYTCLRTAGGHVHVGADNIDLPRLVRTMDLYLGVPSVLLDDDSDRRKMYGLAGCYRTKAYGVEYRVLSNFWLKTDTLKEWVFEATSKAVRDHKTIELPGDDSLQQCINNSDTGLAMRLKHDYRLD
jgi:hypothetical protein